jgi:hypothetical protein
MLFVSTIVQSNILEGLRDSGGSFASVTDNFLKEVSSWTFTLELERNSILPSAPHFHHVLVNFSLGFSVRISIVIGLGELHNLNTLLKLTHHVEILTILYEWEIRGIISLSLDSHSHVRLSEFGVDLLPVEMFLENHCFNPLLEHTVLETKIFDRHTSLILSVNGFFNEWGHSTIVAALESCWVFEELHLFVDFFLSNC